MANVMLSSQSSKDLSKPFKNRIAELESNYNDIISELLLLLNDQEGSETAGVVSAASKIDSNIKKKIEEFNCSCDEIYKEIQRRKQRLLNHDEGPLSSQDLQQQLQTAGQLTQALADFRLFLETGEKPPSNSTT